MAACNRKIDDRKIAKTEERAERVVAGIMVHLPQRQIPGIVHLVPFLIQIGIWDAPVYYLSEKLGSPMGNWD